jgi:hypothetical protein
MLSRTDTNLLDLLIDPAISRLSNREISRRAGHDHHYIAGFRAALAALKWAPPDLDGSVGSDLGPGPTGLPAIPGGPSSGTRNTPGHTIAGEPPALNSWDVWVMATQREKERFVDAVGPQHLFDARIALTGDQVQHYRLPTRPTKRDGNTHANNFDGDSVELDALPSSELRNLVRECIERHISEQQLDVLRSAEKSERLILKQLARSKGAVF